MAPQDQRSVGCCICISGPLGAKNNAFWHQDLKKKDLLITMVCYGEFSIASIQLPQLRAVGFLSRGGFGMARCRPCLKRFCVDWGRGHSPPGRIRHWGPLQCPPKESEHGISRY